MNHLLKGNTDNKVVLVEGDGEDEDEDDWLPPPPQEIIDSSLDLPEDETRRELRSVECTKSNSKFY